MKIDTPTSIFRILHFTQNVKHLKKNSHTNPKNNPALNRFGTIIATSSTSAKIITLFCFVLFTFPDFRFSVNL